MSELEIKTSSVSFDAEVKTFSTELADFVTASKTNSAAMSTSVKTASASFNTVFLTSGYPLMETSALTSPAGLFREEDTKVATSSVEFPKSAPKVATTRIPFSPAKPSVSKKVQFQRISLATLRSPAIDNKMHTREMLNLRYIEYPKLTEIIIKIAEENKLQYTQVQLIGIFDPIPMHLAWGLTLDTMAGKLKYFVKQDPKAKRKFARVAYARVRSTDKIVQTTMPVT